MRISDLDSKTANPTVVLVQTPSVKLVMFLQDKLKAKYRINIDTMLSIQNKTELKEVKNLVGVMPPNSEKWFVEVDLDKFNDKELIPTIKNSDTCLFFIQSAKYGQFKGIKDALGKSVSVFDYYITYLRRPDFIYLYDALTTSDNKLSTQLFNYFVQSYSGDIDSVMTMLLKLNAGEKVESRKDIARICGIGGNTTQSFIFSLLKPLSGSAKGLQTVLKNRIASGLDLGETLGYRTLYNFLRSDLYSFVQIKQLLISGVIYKAIRRLPDSYDERKLSRYQRYLWRLKEIPMTDLLRVYACMGDKQWTDEVDFLAFVYRYYTYESKNLLKQKGVC